MTTGTAPTAITADDTVYIEKVSQFAHLLRAEGFAVGLGECEDACLVLRDIGLEDRDIVKAALRAVFAKSQQELRSFDRLFDSFFISADRKRANILRALQEQDDMRKLKEKAADELTIGGEPLALSDEMVEVYVSMPEEERDRLKRFMDRYRRNYDLNPDLYSGFINSVFMRSLMEQQMMMEDAAVGKEDVDPDLALLFRDISQIGDSEMPVAISLIQKVASRINGEMSARRMKNGNRGVLDFKQTIRKGLETGGTFRKLKYKRKHAKKHRLVLLCDVSASMIQFSEFVLRFIKSLSDTSESSQIFLFSEQIAKVDPFSLANMDMFRSYVRSSGLFGKGTDLGSALESLCTVRPPALGQSTTLLIISDTKTVELDRAVRALLKAKQMCGRVVWLNPIPRRKWDRIRSIQTMSLLCQMVPCSTLSELARECGKLLTA